MGRQAVEEGLIDEIRGGIREAVSYLEKIMKKGSRMTTGISQNVIMTTMPKYGIIN